MSKDECRELKPNTIYLMDYRRLLQRIPNNFVDLILTDPPYGINYRNGYTKHKYQLLRGDDGIDYLDFAQQSYRVLKQNSHAYFFTRFDRYPYHFQSLTQAGFIVKNCLVIEKGSVGGIGDLYGSFANNSEWVIFCHKGRRLFNKTQLLQKGRLTKEERDLNRVIYKTRLNNCWFGSDYPKAAWNPSTRDKEGIKHPTVKNPECLEWLIQLSSNPGDLILDPFMGSGSVALAAKRIRRLFLGSEIDKNYYQMSIKRLSNIGGEIIY